MTYYIGRRGLAGLGKESVRGTKVAPTHTLPVTEFKLDTKASVQVTAPALGNIQDSSASFVTKKYSEGTLKCLFDDKAIGLILTGLFGAAPTTTGTDNYTHTYALANTNVHQSLTVVVKDPNVAVDHALGMVSEFDFSVAPDSVIEHTVGFRSQAGTDGSTADLVTNAQGNYFTHSDFSLKIAANVAGLGAATALNLTAFSLKVSKNVADFNDMGALTPAEIVNKQFTVEGSIELGYGDQVIRDYMLNGDYKAIQATLSKGTNNSVVFTLPRASFSAWESNRPLDDIATQKVSFKGHYDAAAAAAVLSAVLKNQVVSY